MKDTKSKNSVINKTVLGIAIAMSIILIVVLSVIGTPIDVNQNKTTVASADTAQENTEQENTEQETLEQETTVQETETVTETTTTVDDGEDLKDKSKRTNPRNVEEAEKLEKEAKARVYLTFDDGPSETTDEILDILKKYNAKATFFNLATDNSTALKAQERAWEEGHTMAVHSWNHDYSQLYSSVSGFADDVLSQQEYMKEQLGIDVYFYRFPGGSSNTIAANYGTSIYDCIDWLDSHNFLYYDWNVSSGDASGVSYTAEEIAENVLDQIDPDVNNIVLMHDAKSKESTIESLPIIIENLQARGYTFCGITKNTELIQHVN